MNLGLLRRHSLAMIIAALLILAPFAQVALMVFGSSPVSEPSESVSELAVPAAEASIFYLGLALPVLVGIAIIFWVVRKDRRSRPISVPDAERIGALR